MQPKHKPHHPKDYSSSISLIHSSFPNTICFDCNINGTTYFVLNTGTFVCSKCAGILREFHFKVKGLSVSHFTEKDKAIAELCGNDIANDIFMGKFDPKKHKKLDYNSDTKLFKRFLKDKYVRKVFCIKGKEYKQLQELLEEPNNEESENSSYESDDEEEEESDSESEEAEKSDGIKKEMFTKISDMKIKKPCIERNCNKTVEEYKEAREQWRSMWERTEGINKYVNVNDFEFVDCDNNTNDI